MAAAVLDVAEKRQGRVFTPLPLAEGLCRWAIRSPADVVLDLGVGEGAFVLAAAARLGRLGATSRQAAEQLHGAELDPAAYAEAQRAAVQALGHPLPHLACADFYDLPLPAADAVVGNPPYIRRHYQHDPARQKRAAMAARAAGLTGLTDAYCYFLLRACSALRPGGRLAALVSASWLDMQYGQELKRLLTQRFRLQLVLAFDGRVFPNALVKPVVLLAERTPAGEPAREVMGGAVSFARLGRAFPLGTLPESLDDLVAGRAVPKVAQTRVDVAHLAPHVSWSAFLKAPDLYAELRRAVPFAALREVAESRIGLQTFAKRFYILTREEARRYQIETEYLRPLIFSPKDMHSPVLAEAAQTRHMVFACAEPLAALGKTRAGWYIRQGMQAVVEVRGKDQVVQGFHNAPRVVRAGRRPWYNLRTTIERRGTFPILLPRRVFASYVVAHNRAGVVANEDFIEISPKAGERDVVPLLAFLNSSIGEFLVRSHSFQYGGGVFNLNPGAVRELPVPDGAQLSPDQRTRLVRAWETFAGTCTEPSARATLDQDVAGVLRVPFDLLSHLQEAVSTLVGLAHAAGARHGEEGGGGALGA